MKKIAIFTLAIALLAACQKDINEMRSESTLAPKTNTESAKSSTPMKVDFYSTVNPASPLLACTLPGVPFSITNSGFFLHGTATHFGFIDGENSMGQDGSCHLDGATLILTTTPAGQIVAANGDKITYTGADEINLFDVVVNGAITAPITGVWTITGGTGRFTGATGSFTINGMVNLASPGGPTISFTGEGSITF